MSKLFSIGLEVEEVAVGRVLRQLDGMAGVAKINLNLTGQRRGEIADEAGVEPVRALAAPVKPKQVQKINDVRGRCDQAVADALKDSKLHTDQIGSFLMRRGFSRGSVSATLTKMNREGVAKPLGFGNWELTPAGRKQFFGGQKNHSSVSSKPNGRGANWMGRGADNSQGIRRTVLDLLRDGPKPYTEVVKALTSHGYSAKSMTGPVYNMRATDQPALIVKNNDGVFSLTPHGQKEIARIEAEEFKQSHQQSPQSQAAE